MDEYKNKRISNLVKLLNLLAKLTKINNPIYESQKATKQSQKEVNDKVNIMKTIQLVGTTFYFVTINYS